MPEVLKRAFSSSFNLFNHNVYTGIEYWNKELLPQWRDTYENMNTTPRADASGLDLYVTAVEWEAMADSQPRLTDSSHSEFSSVMRFLTEENNPTSKLEKNIKKAKNRYEEYKKYIDNLPADERLLYHEIQLESFKFYLDKLEAQRPPTTGGRMHVDNFNVHLDVHKRATRPTTKWVSTSLFDKKSCARLKGISEYCWCLQTSLDLYQKYLPDYNIRIYIDSSITENPKSEVTDLLDVCQALDYVEVVNVTQHMGDIPMFDKRGDTNVGHLDLLATMFRFYPMFDDEVTHSLFVDADNFPTFVYAKVVRTWEASGAQLLHFTTPSYTRANKKNQMLPQILAGMFGISKPEGTIVNPLLWIDMFAYIAATWDPADVCNETPFTFGFEEQALTNVFLAFCIKKDVSVFAVPFVFEHNESNYQLLNYVVSQLDPQFVNLVDKSIAPYKIEAIEEYTKSNGNGFPPMNIHLSVFIWQTIFFCLSRGKNDILNKEFNLENVQKAMSIVGYFAMYPEYNILIPVRRLENTIIDVLKGQRFGQPDTLAVNGHGHFDIQNSVLKHEADEIRERILGPRSGSSR